jgi:hypothetical protein
MFYVKQLNVMLYMWYVNGLGFGQVTDYYDFVVSVTLPVLIPLYRA